MPQLYCTITVDGQEIQGAVCPVCKGKFYPPENVKLCTRRHKEIAARHSYKICIQCHQPRPDSRYNRARRRCDDCTGKKAKPPQPKQGQAVEFADYLSEATYAWGE